MSSSEQDTKDKYVSLFSVQIQDIDEIRLQLPSNVEPFIRLLQLQINELQQTIKSLRSTNASNKDSNTKSRTHSKNSLK